MTPERFAGRRLLFTLAAALAVLMAVYLGMSTARISAVQAQTKSASQQSLDKIIQSLKALDTAYASGNTVIVSS